MRKLLLIIFLIPLLVVGQVSFNYVTVPLSLDADAAKFIKAAQLTSMTDMVKVNNFVKGCKSDGTWTKLKAAYPFMGITETQHAYNLVDTGTYKITWSKSTGSYDTQKKIHHTGGVKWQNRMWGKTGLVPSTVFTGANEDKITIGVYMSQALSGSGSWEMGAITSTTKYTALIVRNIASPFTSSYMSSAKSADNTTLTPIAGTYVASRTAVNSNTLYRNDTSIATNTGTISAGASTSDKEMYIGVQNNNGTEGTQSASNYEFAYVSDGLTSGEVTSLNARIKMLKTPVANPYWADTNIIFRRCYLPWQVGAEMYILNQTNQYAVGRRGTTIYMSKDHMETWSDSTTALGADTITNAIVFSNGKVVLFTMGSFVYKSSDFLHTLTRIPVRKTNGDTLDLQSPIGNGSFATLNAPINITLPRGEVGIFAPYTNYGTYSGGWGYPYAGSQVNIYMVRPDTVWAMYRFGEFQGGTAGGGTMSRGDPTNTKKCSHVHGIARNQSNTDLYAFTGDDFTDSTVLIMKGVYNGTSKFYDFTVQTCGKQNYHAKIAGAVIVNDTLFSVADVTGKSVAHYCGIFKAPLSALSDSSKWTKALTASVVGTGMGYGNGTMVAFNMGTSGFQLIYSNNNGLTWKGKGIDGLAAGSSFIPFVQVDDQGYMVGRNTYQQMYGNSVRFKIRK